MGYADPEEVLKDGEADTPLFVICNAKPTYNEDKIKSLLKALYELEMKEVPVSELRGGTPMHPANKKVHVLQEAPAKKDDVLKAVALIKGIQKKILNSRKCDILHMPHDEYIDCICPGGCDLVVSSSTSTTDDDGTHVSTSTSTFPAKKDEVQKAVALIKGIQKKILNSRKCDILHMPHDEYIDCICPGGCDLVVSSS